MMGRPSLYTPETAATICERIALGEGLAAICRDEAMPSARTVMAWVRDDLEGFQRDYAHAREEQAEADADAVTDIGLRCLSGEYDAQAARVAIDAYKWSAGKRNAKKYGDKIQHANDPDNPMPAPTFILQPVAPKADD